MKPFFLIFLFLFGCPKSGDISIEEQERKKALEELMSSDDFDFEELPENNVDDVAKDDDETKEEEK